VATDAQGQLYILDATNNSIDVLSKTGTPLKVIGSSAGFYHPRGIAVSPAGDIYVGDPGRNRIVRFSSDGTMISSLNTPIGSNPDQLNQPTSVAVDKQGHVYVVDTLNNRVDEFSPSTGATWSRG